MKAGKDFSKTVYVYKKSKTHMCYIDSSSYSCQNVWYLVSLVQQRLLLFMKEQKEKKIQLGQFSVTTRSFSGGCGFGHHYTHHRYQLSCFQMQNSAVQKQDSGSGIRHAPHYLSVPRILESLLLDGHHYSICIIIPFNSIIIGLITEILLFLLN